MALPRSRRSVLMGYHPPRSRMSRKKEWVSDLTDSERDREGLPPVSALSAQRSMEEAFEPAIAAGGSGKSWSQGAYSREGSDIEWRIAQALMQMYGGAKAGQLLGAGMGLGMGKAVGPAPQVGNFTESQVMNFLGKSVGGMSGFMYALGEDLFHGEPNDEYWAKKAKQQEVEERAARLRSDRAAGGGRNRWQR